MNEYMSIKEIADISGTSESTVKRKIKEVFPDLTKKGIKTKLSKEQSILIVNELRVIVKKQIQPAQNDRLPAQNEQVNIISMFSEMQKQNHEFMKMMLSELKDIKSAQPKQIEIKQDYYSILGYCRLKEITIAFSDAVRFGKIATKRSNEMGLDIRKVPDERYGQVNSYNIKALEKVFEL